MNSSAQNILDDLLDNGDFFKFREELNYNRENLSRKDFIYYSSFCESAFDNCEVSNELITTFFKEFGEHATDQERAELIKTKGDNMVRHYRYVDAADAYSEILSHYEHVLEEREITDILNNYSLFNTLSDIPAQTCELGNGKSIPYSINKFGHMIVEAGTVSDRSEFIFDTGANISTISQTYAEKMGMKILEANVEIGTSTTIKVYSKLAIAEVFYVGEILFRNVVFLVLPDEHLSFPEMDFQINGVLGFPVIYQMREIRIDDSQIIVPPNPTPKSLKNLCLEGLMPVINVFSGSSSLVFTLDTGANKTELSYRYYHRNKEYIEQMGVLSKSLRGGGGGVIESQTYELENLPLRIGNRDIVIPEVSVSMENYLFNENKDGNLGQDALSQGSMVLSFEYMYVDLE